MRVGCGFDLGNSFSSHVAGQPGLFDLATAISMGRATELNRSKLNLASRRMRLCLGSIQSSTNRLAWFASGILHAGYGATAHPPDSSQ
jgi:hypothetical protein